MSKRRAEDEDEAFPRGGGGGGDAKTILADDEKVKERRKDGAGVKEKSKDKGREKKQPKGEAVAEDEDDTMGGSGLPGMKPLSCRRLVTRDLVEGSLVVAAVREISDEEVILNLPYNLLGFVPRSQASEPMVSGTEAPALTELYRLGQLVVAVVTAVTEIPDTKKHRVDLSLRPSIANAGIDVDNLTPHMWLPATIQSEEEHVFNLSFGVTGLRGVLKKSEVSSASIAPIAGLIMQVAVHSLNGQLVKCKAAASEALSGDLLKPESLKAGLLVQCRVDKLLPITAVKGVELPEDANGGLVANFCGSFNGVIHWHHQEVVAGSIKRKQKLEARVLAVIPGDHLTVHLSLLPHLLDWSDRCQALADVAVGSWLDGEVLDSQAKYGCRLACIRKDAAIGSAKIRAFCPSSRLADKGDGSSVNVDVGTRASCRVLTHNFLDLTTVVTRRPADLKEDCMISVGELNPGQVVSGTVRRVAAFGLFVQLSEFVTGLVHLRQLTDVPLATVSDKYQVGKPVKCRVVRVFPERKQVSLTLKKTLMKEDFQLADFGDAKKNMLVNGFVSKIQDYGAIVSFYGDIYGLIDKAEMEGGQAPALGMAVRVRISGINNKKKRLKLSLNLEGGLSPAELETTVANKATGASPGITAEAVHAVSVRDDGVVVEFTARGVAAIEGFVPLPHLSDDTEQAVARHKAIAAKLQKSGNERVSLGDGVVLAKLFNPKENATVEEGKNWPHVALVSCKPTLRLAVEDGSFVTKLEDLQAPRLYTGYVKEAKDFGVLVSVGSWRLAGLAPKHQIAEHFVEDPSKEFKAGQTVRVLVNKINTETKRYMVDLRPTAVTASDSALLKREAAALRQFFELHRALAPKVTKSEPWASLHPGLVIDAIVTAQKPYGMLLKLEGREGLTALALKENMADGSAPKEGEKVQCAVLDLNFERNIVDVSLQPELVAAQAKGTKRKKGVEPASTNGSNSAIGEAKEAHVLPALQKSAYSVLWSKSPAAVVFSPPWERQKWTAPRAVLMHSVPDTPSLFERNLACCPLGGKPERLGKVPKILRPAEELQVGSPLTMRIQKIGALQALCSAAVGLRGHLHATQMADGGAVGSVACGGRRPMEELKKKGVVEARITTMQQRGEAKGGKKIWHVDLTCRASLNNGEKDIAEYDEAAVRWKNLRAGRQVSVAIAAVKKECLWVEVAPGIKGRISAFDASPNMSVVKALHEHFQVGQVYEALVVRAVSSKKELDLSLLPSSASEKPPAGPTLAKLLKLEDVKGRGIAATFRLPGRRKGYAHITELFDFWAQFPLKRLKPGTVCEAVVLKESEASVKRGGQAELTLRGSAVHGQAVGPEEVRPLKAEDVKKNQKLSGYVVNSNEKGVFVALSRSLVGRIRLKALSDSPVLKDSVSRLHPAGTLIKDATVIEIDKERNCVELSLRKGNTANRLTADLMNVGDVVSGKVKAIQKYGIFVRIDNSSMDALAHHTEVSDTASVSLESYKVGDVISRAKVVKIENGKINIGLKASYFEDDEAEDSDEDLLAALDGADDDDDELMEVEAEEKPEKKKEKQKETKVEEKKPPKVATKAKDDDDDAAPWDLAAAAGAEQDGAAFDWADFSTAAGKAKKDATNEAEEDSGEENEDGSRRPTKRQKKALKKAETEAVIAAEKEQTDLADGGRNDPKSAQDFEKLLLTQGDTSIVWIRYMAFHLKMSDLEFARQVAERAVKHVGFAEGKERFNVWVAYLNLECTFGSEQNSEAVFKRAAAHNNPKHMQLQLAKIHDRNKKYDQAMKVYEACCKKFPQSKKVWLAYLTSLYTQGSLDAGRKALPKCLAALPKRKHPLVVSKSALLEYQQGSPERGRSIFEGLMDSFPKRTDLWSVYIDAHIKAYTPPSVVTMEGAEVRSLLERCCTMKLKAVKMRFFFKKWLDFEKRWGDAESQEQVRGKAREFVESQGN